MINTSRKRINGGTEKTKKHEAFLFILSYVKSHVGSVLAGVFLLIFVDLIQLIIPKVIQRIIDILGNASFSNTLITKNTLLILAMAIAMVVIRFFWRIFIMGTARKIEKEVREDMFSHLQSLDFAFFNRTQTGSLMALMVNDVNAMRMATGPSFIALTDAIFMGTLSLFFLFSINIQLTFFSILPLPLILLLIAKFGPLLQSRFKAVQESFSEISSSTQESFSGIRVVKGFVQENAEINNFQERCDDYVQKNLQLIKIWGFFFPSVTLLANLSLAIVYLVGGRYVILGSISFGELVSFTMYINLLVWPVIAIGWVFNIFQRGLASAKRILELLNAEPDIYDGKNVNVKVKKIEGEIEIRDLSFKYLENSDPVLRDINLSIPAGTSLGIMGKPGAGKSALISLFFRLFSIMDNSIFIDGHDINTIPLAVLRGSIGYVPQDPFLFSDTVKNNIAFGLREDDNTDEEVVKVSRIISMYDEIMEFDKKFDTIIGERGITLSGGQKQRLSIARALIVKPNVLILDDALSSVDAAKEKEILQNITMQIQDRTKIIISHRVSTVKECDNIIVLERGRIIESGNHDQLVDRSGYYSQLFELQKLEEKLD